MPPAFEIAGAVRSYPGVASGDPFAELLASTQFEDVGKGRRGAVLTRPDEARGVPVVRTTTQYRTPAQRFRPVHERLARRIQEAAPLPAEFNNALVEVYAAAYATMGAHSDQALDLADGSSIAVFSCYERPERAVGTRTLLVEAKEGGEKVAIPLAHNSAVVFSRSANRLLRHKIVLDAPPRAPENRWLGVTFRVSGTFVRFRDGRAALADGTPLTLAGDEQRREFYHLRHRENAETDFSYPPLAYTISGSDLVPPLG